MQWETLRWNPDETDLPEHFPFIKRDNSDESPLRDSSLTMNKRCLLMNGALCDKWQCYLLRVNFLPVESLGAWFSCKQLQREGQRWWWWDERGRRLFHSWRSWFTGRSLWDWGRRGSVSGWGMRGGGWRYRWRGHRRQSFRLRDVNSICQIVARFRNRL